jgi:hypothetical protein
MDDDLNDSLDDMLDAEYQRAPKVPPPSYKKPETYFEACSKCGGTGQTRWGTCFRCKGKKGKSYKTSADDRAKSRQQATQRKVSKAKENLTAFAVAHPTIAAWIAANPKFDFAKKMEEAITKWGRLTEGQLAACERLVERDKARAAERQSRVDNAPTVDVSKIEKAFETALAKANRPGARGVWLKPLMLQSGEHPLKFTLGTEKWTGMIFVKVGEKKLGAIKDGKFTRRFECTAAEEAAVLDACSDPLKAAIAYGKAWSCCAVCGQTLTNDASIARGIGPICADKYGW